MQVQTSALVGWYRGDRKQWTSVHSPFFPPKRGRKQKKAKEAWKQPIYDKTCCLDADFFYTDAKISNTHSEIKFDPLSPVWAIYPIFTQYAWVLPIFAQYCQLSSFFPNDWISHSHFYILTHCTLYSFLPSKSEIRPLFSILKRFPF